MLWTPNQSNQCNKSTKRSREDILNIRNLEVAFHTDEGVVHAVNKISYDLLAGQMLGIVGESGSGKSVSSLAAMDLLPKPPAVITGESSIKFKGRELIGLSKHEWQKIRGRQISMVFQDPMTSLNPYLRLDLQLIEGMKRHLGLSSKEALKKIFEVLELIQFPDALRHIYSYPHQLSGGMRQRIMIAIALACDPQIIFADEPTTALDVTVQAQILQLFKKIQKELGTSIVLISHDLGVIGTQCDQILVMYAGSIMESGTPEQIFEKSAHPYTKGLKDSIPDLYDEQSVTQPLKEMGGVPPSLARLTIGCPFADRCTAAELKCQKQSIPMRELELGHFMRCIH